MYRIMHRNYINQKRDGDTVADTVSTVNLESSMISRNIAKQNVTQTSPGQTQRIGSKGAAAKATGR
jgi:hypothetical protein